MIAPDHIKWAWEAFQAHVLSPQGLGTLETALRGVRARLDGAESPGGEPSQAGARQVWVQWPGTPGACSSFATVSPFGASQAAPAAADAWTQIAEGHSAWLYSRLLRLAIRWSREGVEEVWLNSDDALPLRLLVLACRQARLPTVLDLRKNQRSSQVRPHPRAPLTDVVVCGGETAAALAGTGYPRAHVAPAGTETLPRRDASEAAYWVAHLLRDDPVSRAPYGVAATHHPARTTLHVPHMLGFSAGVFRPSVREAAEVDVFYKWGVRRTVDRSRLDRLASIYGRPTFIAEDGLFLRSIGLGAGDAREDALSVTIDTETAYYDTTRPSRLEQRLSSDAELDATQVSRARACIDALRRHKLTKYNHTPSIGKRIGSRTRRKVLLLDQRFLDSSVRYGLASAKSFDAMVQFALHERSDHEILIKRHPDATRGGFPSYFSDERLARYSLPVGRARVVDEDINPHDLLAQVEEVFVVTSGFGFEAVLAGIEVHCFGAPFYAGWGLTHDHVAVPRRRRERTAVDLFHFAAIEAAVYWSPEEQKLVPIEAAITRMAHQRQRLGL